MGMNKITGTTIVTPDEWELRTAEFRGKGDPNTNIDIAQIPRAMLINGVGPYAALTEEPANHFTRVHHHTEAEVIVVVSGRMILNGEWCTPGTVVHVPAGEEYWHATLDEACVMVIIRPDERGVSIHGLDTRVAQTERVPLAQS
jgi:mannose-6-phosphate isomerase-like protein (cupin superfamily)